MLVITHHQKRKLQNKWGPCPNNLKVPLKGVLLATTHLTRTSQLFGNGPRIKLYSIFVVEWASNNTQSPNRVCFFQVILYSLTHDIKSKFSFIATSNVTLLEGVVLTTLPYFMPQALTLAVLFWFSKFTFVVKRS